MEIGSICSDLIEKSHSSNPGIQKANSCPGIGNHIVTFHTCLNIQFSIINIIYHASIWETLVFNFADAWNF
jgi:hypothetical protein